MVDAERKIIPYIIGCTSDTNLGLAEEFCASVIKASEGKTGVHLINVSVKGIREAALREEIRSNLFFISLAQLISASGGVFNTVEIKKIPSESIHSMTTLNVNQVNGHVLTMI